MPVKPEKQPRPDAAGNTGQVVTLFNRHAKPAAALELHHQVENLEDWVYRVRTWGTFPHLTVPAFVVDESRRPVPLAERLEILRSLPDVDDETVAEVEAHEPDVWVFADRLAKLENG